MHLKDRIQVTPHWSIITLEDYYILNFEIKDKMHIDSHCPFSADQFMNSGCSLIGKDKTVRSSDLTVQLISADAKPCGRGLRLSVGGSIGSQQVQSPHGVNVEVFLQPQGSFQNTDGVSCLLFQLRA